MSPYILTTKFIYDNINGKTSLQELIGLTKKTYNVNENIDEDIYELLNKLWKIGLIKWKDNILPDNDKYTINMGDYIYKIARLDNVTEFITTSIVNCTNYKNPLYSTDIPYEEIPLIIDIMKNYRFAFSLYKGQECLCKFLIKYDYMDTIFSLDIISISKDLEKEDVYEIKAFLQYICEYIKSEASFYIENIKKITLITLVKEDDINTKNIMETISFVCKGTLHNEIPEGNINYYVIQ